VSQKNRKGKKKCNKIIGLAKYAINLVLAQAIPLLLAQSPSAPVSVYLYAGDRTSYCCMVEPSDQPIATLGLNGGNSFDYSLRQSATSSNPKIR